MSNEFAAKTAKPLLPNGSPRKQQARSGLFALTLGLAFLILAGQLVRLALISDHGIRLAAAIPIGTGTARPDILDRNGRLIATDLPTPSLVADPSLIIGVDETAEALAGALPSLKLSDVRAALADPSKRFTWLARGMKPSDAQIAFDLGLPGVSFRDELRRAYPAADATGRILGAVDTDNRGLFGLERWIDQQRLTDSVDRPARSTREPVVSSIDLAAQFAMREELQAAIGRYQAKAAAGVFLDIETGEILAANSLPDFPAGAAAASLDPANIDRLTSGTYELGSVFKTLTLALALDAGTATLDKSYDATEALHIGKYSIDDLHPQRRWLTVEEVFLHSSNIGTARIADELGEDRFLGFMSDLGLMSPLETEAGSAKSMRMPPKLGRLGTMTAAFGHGIALTPLQFAVAAAPLFNGGKRINATFLKRRPGEKIPDGAQVLKPQTVELMRQLMRANVEKKEGTGKLANVAGYEVGGKTGTADIAGVGGYGKSGVISSFLAVLPAHHPRYLSYVVLFEPEENDAGEADHVAGHNAAPTTAKIIARLAPILGLAPVYGPGGT